MNNDRNRTGTVRGISEDALATLIREAGTRETPPREHYDAVFAAASDALDQKIRGNRRKNVFAWAAGIAAIAILATWVMQMEITESVPVQVATTDRVVGVARIMAAADDRWRSMHEDGTTLLSGARIRTEADGAVGLMLMGNVSLRLAAATEITIESASRIHLHQGTVYVDTGLGYPTDRITEIITANGVARDIGTQFEVRYSNSAVRLRVREGIVLFRQQAEEYRGVAGEQLIIEDVGVTARHAVARDADDWYWVQAIAPAPHSDEQTVAGLVRWVARETGRDIHFARDDIGMRAETTLLHGNRRRLMPMEALSVMLETTDFEYVVTAGGEILIQQRRDRRL